MLSIFYLLRDYLIFLGVVLFGIVIGGFIAIWVGRKLKLI